jgi:uncharacterized Zn finger protein
MAFWNPYPRYVPVAERRAKARRQAEKLGNKIGNLEPVILSGRTLAASWWGRSWNGNLERYADFENRVGRGRSYVRNGMVLDLKIGKGSVTAVVAGSGSAPYRVRVAIKTLPQAAWKRLTARASGRVESMKALLSGSFPEELKELFFAEGHGLFPRPSEISFDCSCPDWASMCKHVAAALYGVGARLDSSPELFFTLRGVSMEELAGKVARAASEEILLRENARSERIMDASGRNAEDLEALFGISMADGAAAAPSREPTRDSPGNAAAGAPPKCMAGKRASKRIPPGSVTRAPSAPAPRAPIRGPGRTPSRGTSRKNGRRGLS